MLSLPLHPDRPFCLICNGESMVIALDGPRVRISRDGREWRSFRVEQSHWVYETLGGVRFRFTMGKRRGTFCVVFEAPAEVVIGREKAAVEP